MSVQVTPHPKWVADLDAVLDPSREAILDTRVIVDASENQLVDGRIQNFLVNFYPIIRDFPQWLQVLLEVADDRVEVHEEILDAAVDQLVLGGVHDHASIEDSLAARIQNGIQVGHPFWVGGHLYGHRVSSQGARAMEKGFSRGLQM